MVCSARLAQMRLEFAEGQFDRVEVGRILREINARLQPIFAEPALHLAYDYAKTVNADAC